MSKTRISPLINLESRLRFSPPLPPSPWGRERLHWEQMGKNYVAWCFKKGTMELVSAKYDKILTNIARDNLAIKS